MCIKCKNAQKSRNQARFYSSKDFIRQTLKRESNKLFRLNLSLGNAKKGEGCEEKKGIKSGKERKRERMRERERERDRQTERKPRL